MTTRMHFAQHHAIGPAIGGRCSPETNERLTWFRSMIVGQRAALRLLQIVATVVMVLAAPATAFAQISVSPTTLTAATIGQVYNQTISASGGTAPYTFAITSGALPAGLTLSSGGVLSGTPTAAGSFTFAVTATDSTSATGSQGYTLSVFPGIITISPPVVSAGTVGTSYNQQFTASGGTSPYTFSVSSGNLPNGLTLSTAGLLSGTPTTAGSVTFTISAKDSSTGTGPFTGSTAYFMAVNAPLPSPPTISATFSPTSIAVSGISTLTFTIGNPNSALALAGVAFTDVLPAGLVIATPNGLVSTCGGTSTATAGGNSFGLTGGSVVASGSCTITVNVTATSAGTFANTTSAVSSTNAGTGNSATATLTVTTPATTTTLASSLNPSALGQLVTFTATVASGSGTPTGTVTFKDGAITIGTGTLSGGVATFTTSALAVGSHAISATYAGDANFTGSASGPLTQTVNPASATVSLSSSVNPSAFGQAVTFTATVTGASPTGTVTFRDGAATLGTGTLSGGAATFTTSGLATGSHSITAVYGGDTNNTGATSAVLTETVGQSATTVSLSSSLNPSLFGQAVTFTATVTGTSPTGTVTFKDGAATLGTGTLGGGAATFTTSTLAAGSHAITAVYGGDTNNAGATSATVTQIVNQSATTTMVASSRNPSTTGQPVTFTITVSSSGGTPTGTVTVSDGGAAIGTATLAAGVATFTTASLALGSHTITASYAGTARFTASTSAPLIQAVNTPADSLKLRAMQTLATPVVAQVWAQTVSGAVDGAIGEGFGDGGPLVSPSANGIRFNLTADPDAAATEPARPPGGVAARLGGRDQTSAWGIRPAPQQPTSASRVDDAFAALSYAAPAKAPPKPVREPREWLAWAEVRGTTLDRWNVAPLGSVATAPMLYGNQIDALVGLTRKLTPYFLVGVLGGYENFDYRSDMLTGRLKGDGWTLGSYLGWRITDSIRFDAAVAYSGVGYDGSAGTAAGSFAGDRWLVSGGLTGTYRYHGLMIEPSAKIYALWEHENAYTDTLGTLQPARDFTSGRASGGVKLTYPVAWLSGATLAPYVGLYSDYYFNGDTAAASALAAASVPPVFLLDGWSARVTGGVSARFDNGAQIAIGAERGGIGGDFALWTYRARASVPFSAQ